MKGRAIVANLMFGGFWNHSGGYGEEFGLGKPATIDSITRAVIGTSTTMNERNFEDRLQARGNLTWYKPDWLGGNHEIKVGSDFFKVRADRQRLPRPGKRHRADAVLRGLVSAAAPRKLGGHGIHPDGGDRFCDA